MPDDPASRTLRAALVAAYPPYVARVVAERGLAPIDLGESVAAGSGWLDTALADLLHRPYREQRRGPLEVFQEAMRFPTAALEAAGAEPAQRDVGAAAALPGDRYHLAPASSQALGESVWEAHLAWGAAKARSLRPSVGLLSRDLMDRSKVEAVVEDAGYRLVSWGDAGEMESSSERVAVAFVDLNHPDADEAIRRLAGDGVRTVGFGPHVDDLAMVRARSLGAADALPRSVFFRTLADLLPSVV